MTRKPALAVSAALCLSLITSPAIAVGPPVFTPGAPDVGDEYFPGDGNGGYDVQHYLLDVRYDPGSDELNGVATITAKATQNLSSFNLDLDEPMAVAAVTVNGTAAAWDRVDGELVITPAKGIRNNTRFVVAVSYGGIPQTIDDLFGISGFIHTDDGALVVGQPHVAATWFPANDHPSDRAAFTFRVTVPDGLEAVANGVLAGQTSAGGWTTWQWEAPDPMATYLAGMSIGELAIDAYRVDRIQYWDAIDPRLFDPVAIPFGTHLALSQAADSSYKRLSREIAVPADGVTTLSFKVVRSTEPGWDFFFVEAHEVGSDGWTTLRDMEGHASQDTGFSCPGWHEIHPFLGHYQSPPADEFEPCAATGTTGQWWAASGESEGWETWTIDLSAYAGKTVEVALAYASDEVVQLEGVFIDDIVVSTGAGSTGFEAGTLDGWSVPGSPDGSPENENDWVVGTASDVPLKEGVVASESFSHQDDIISFLESIFGPYPFNVAGGIVDEAPIFFALENQTRPIYSKLFFSDTFSGDLVIVHELAHQWFGDDLTIAEWQHIWLNEGFATYAEWLWLEEIGFDTAQGSFDFFYNAIPEEAVEFWDVTIGDPGPAELFNFAVYARGAMTLHQVRLAVGDAAFFKIVEQWAQLQSGDLVSTDEFIELAEKVSGQQLDELFDTWLFTSGKPALDDVEISQLRTATGSVSADLRLRSLDGALRK